MARQPSSPAPSTLKAGWALFGTAGSCASPTSRADTRRQLQVCCTCAPRPSIGSGGNQRQSPRPVALLRLCVPSRPCSRRDGQPNLCPPLYMYWARSCQRSCHPPPRPATEPGPFVLSSAHGIETIAMCSPNYVALRARRLCRPERRRHLPALCTKRQRAKRQRRRDLPGTTQHEWQRLYLGGFLLRMTLPAVRWIGCQRLHLPGFQFFHVRREHTRFLLVLRHSVQQRLPRWLILLLS